MVRPKGSEVFAALLLLTGFQLPQQWELRVCADPNALPFSHRSGAGFENRIAQILAEELGARLSFVWWPQGEGMIHEKLREGECDVIMGVPDGTEPLLTTIAYYRSPYVFVYRADSPFQVRSLDDPVLRAMDIGVQRSGIPPHQALVSRGLAGNVTLQYGLWGGEPSDPLEPIIRAVANQEVDIGLAWGPVAGYYATRQSVDLKVVPVSPEFDPPFTSMVMSITIGVRRGDEALRDRLDLALARRWEQVQEVLEQFGVPRSPLPRPIAPAQPS